MYTKNIGVIYDFPCSDGTYSALNLYLYLKHFHKKSYRLDFHPQNSNHRISEVLSTTKYDKVYILDKSFQKENFVYLLTADIPKVCIIDHHSSSIDLYNKEFTELFSTLKK
jgi:nanoRNase/pAp phosphatase (c-di-AMP/oligoRNAs hydrolase)